MKLTKDLWILDLRKYLWKRVFQKKSIAYRENAFFLSNSKTNRIYLFGGNSENEVFSLNIIYEIDLNSHINDIVKCFESDAENIQIDWKEINLKKINNKFITSDFSCEVTLSANAIFEEGNQIFIFGGKNRYNEINNLFFKIDLNNNSIEKLNNFYLNDQKLLPRLNPVTNIYIQKICLYFIIKYIEYGGNENWVNNVWRA